MHDPFAAAVALDPTVARTRPACVDVETEGALTRGTTIADERQFWGRENNADIADATDPELFFDALIERVAAFAVTVQQLHD